MAPKRPQLTNVLAGYLPPVVWGSQPPSPAPAPAPAALPTPTRPGHLARPVRSAEGTLEPLIEPDDADDWLDDEAQTTFRPAMTPPPAEPVGSSHGSPRPPTVSRVRQGGFPAGELITPAPQQPISRRTASGLASTPAAAGRGRLASVLATSGVCMAVCAVGFLAVTAYHHLSASAPSGPLIERSRTLAPRSAASTVRVEPLALAPTAMVPVPSAPTPAPAPPPTSLPAAAPPGSAPAPEPTLDTPLAGPVAAAAQRAPAAPRAHLTPRRPIIARPAPRATVKRTVRRPARKAAPAGSGWVDPFADP